MLKKVKLLLLVSFLFNLNSCNEFQKVLKNEDIKIKYDMAETYYENQEFRRASRLFEQIKPKYRGKPQGERITFFYANSLLNTNSYMLAAYEFESFAKAYPLSQKVEEANYLAAFAYYKVSPIHSLDQKESSEAIEKLQEFINFYPNSEKMSDANDLVQELRLKLEFKAFEIAKQYNTIRDYKSAIIVLDDFISDYPGTPYREDALFYLFDSSYELAVNSINTKKPERLDNAKKIYQELLNTYPESKYIVKSNKLIEVIEKEITIFANN
jgi:outer membrane protein assembly factor BamD